MRVPLFFLSFFILQLVQAQTTIVLNNGEESFPIEEIHSITFDSGITNFNTTNNNSVQYGVNDIDQITFKNSVITNSSTEEFIHSIYPNPTNGLFTVESGSNIENIIIHNYSGRMIQLHKPQKSMLINLNGLEHGIYFIQFIGSDFNKTSTIIYQ